MKIYVVMRSEGKYSDRRVWIQTAFMLEERAKQWVEEKDALVREFFVKNEDALIWDDDNADLVQQWNAILGDNNDSLPTQRPSFYIEETEVQI